MRAASYVVGQQRHREERDHLLTRFVSTLPEAGWEGSCVALELALLSVVERFPDLKRVIVPRGTGLGRQLSASEGDLQKLGWCYWIRRSRKTGRTFVFERVKQPTVM